MQFTQFLFPDRSCTTFDIAVHEEVEFMADELKAAGWQFEIECNPRTGMVHGDCCNEEGQLANFLVENGPAVPDEIVTMVKNAHTLWTKFGKPLAVDFDDFEYEGA